MVDILKKNSKESEELDVEIKLVKILKEHFRTLLNIRGTDPSKTSVPLFFASVVAVALTISSGERSAGSNGTPA